MATLQVHNSIKDDDVLWRYLPLEGLVSLLDSGTLYFSPLDNYRLSDPFEGYLPKVAIDAIADISRNANAGILADIGEFLAANPRISEIEITRLRNQAQELQSFMYHSIKKIISCITVSCWNRSAHESEAMWGLYARNGIAIQTSVKSIRSALSSNEQPHIITMGALKYLDFADSSLTAADCVSADGHLMGMIKRIAYAHENEVRMMISGDIDPHNPDSAIPTPKYVETDMNTLIERLVISPFATIPMKISIRAIVKKYNIDKSKLHESPLLENCEYLLDAYKADSRLN